MIFFENKLLQQSDVVFDFESNGRNFSSLAPPGGGKKIIFNFFYKMTSRVGLGVFIRYFWLNEMLRKVLHFFFSPPDGARDLKLRPFDSKSKTTSGCSNSLFSKKSPLTVCFHFTNLFILEFDKI